MNILKIVSSQDGGGVLTCETQFIQRLQAIGHEVTLIIVGNGPKYSHYKGIVEKSIQIDDLKRDFSGNLIERFQGLYLTFVYAKQMLEIVKPQLLNQSFGAIIFRRPNYIFFAGMLSSHLSSKAFWYLPGIVSSSAAKKIYKALCGFYDITAIGNSQFTMNNIKTFCKHFVYPGFNRHRVAETSENYRNELRIPVDAPVFGMVARVCHEKAQDLLIGGFLLSNALKCGAHLIIAGGSKDNLFLKKITDLSSKNLGRQIHFIGEITQLPKFYNTIDVAVNSRRNVEAFGISVAEALGAKKPVIAFSLGGPYEMVETGVNGWLTSKSDEQSYKSLFDIAYSSKDSWDVMGQKGFERSNVFSVEYNVDKLVGIIESELLTQKER